MGFGKRGFPEDIKLLDFGKLANPQCRIMEEWMGVPNNHLRFKDVERRAELKKVCLANLPRAQVGYEVIVLGKEPDKNTPKIEEPTEARYLKALIDVINKDREEIGKLATDGVQELLEKVSKRINSDAREALARAAENFRPLAIVGPDAGKPKKIKGVLPPEFERMVQLASQRIPIMLVGPAGCGKTYLCEKLAEALNLEYSDQSCSEGMSESVFNGLLLPVGKDGGFEHVASPFMLRYENGGVMLLDEIDAGDPNLFTYANKAVANPFYTVAQRYKKPVVKKHSDFVLVAAANTFGHGADAMYVGRNQLDAATLDRFKVGLIQMDYCQEVEKSLAPDDLCIWAWKIRDGIRKHKLRRIMSTRVIRDLATMTRAYKWKKEDWESTYFSSWPQEEKEAVMKEAA